MASPRRPVLLNFPPTWRRRPLFPPSKDLTKTERLQSSFWEGQRTRSTLNVVESAASGTGPPGRGLCSLAVGALVSEQQFEMEQFWWRR